MIVSSSLLLCCMVLVTFFNSVTVVQAQPLSTTCPLIYTRDLIPITQTDVWYRYGVDSTNQSVSVELTYASQAWLGFGFSTTGKMVPAVTIIGLPDDKSVYQYYMKGYTITDTLLIFDNTAYSGLYIKDIAQNTTHTVLSFTRSFAAPGKATYGEVDFTPDAANMFIWAAGSSNPLAMHIIRGAATIPIPSDPTTVACFSDAAVPTTTTTTSAPVAATTTTSAPVTATTTTSAPVTATTTTSAPVSVPVAVPVPTATADDCAFRGDGTVMTGSNNLVTVKNMVNVAAQTISIQVSYAGQGYVAFGFSTTGKMNPSTSVIGLPDDQTILKYDMTGYSVAQVVPIADANQQASITNAKITQADPSLTVLEFTRPLIEDPSFTGEVNTDGGGVATGTSATATSNMFIWAAGTQNALGSHTYRGSESFTTYEYCGQSIPTTTATTSAPAAVTVPTATTTTSAPVAATTTMAPVATTTTMAPAAATTTMAPAAATTTSAPAATVPTAPVATVPTNDGDYDCSFRGAPYVIANSESKISLRNIIHPVKETVTVEVTYAGLGYVSLGFSTTGKMTPSTAVIGLPDDQTVLPYSMMAYSVDSVTPIAGDTSLTNTKIEQNATHTVLTYTRPLAADPSVANGVTVNIDTPNMFIWAVGATNALGVHPIRGNDTVKFDTCLQVGSTLAPTVFTTKAPSAAPAAAAAPVAVDDAALGKMLATGLYAKIVPSEDQKSVTVEVTYLGTGKYISLGLSTDGKMAGSMAIVGSTDNPLPMKYDMKGYSTSDVTLAPQERQTLTDTVFVQNDTHTYMKFTKLATEPGEIPINMAADTIFLYALGRQATVGPHDPAAEFTCNPATTCSSGALAAKKSRKAAWLAHGIMMMLAWVIFIPSAVAASLLRQLLPPGPLWFKTHKNVNMFGILLTFIGFVIAVVTVQQENKDHFTLNAHYKCGLVIFIFALFQALNGIYKPPAPAPPPPPPAPESLPEQKKTDADDDDNANASPQVVVPPAPAAPPQKSCARLSWEIYHRILGFGLVGISWYNCDSGFKLFYRNYEDDYTTAMWGIIGGLLGLFVVLYTYAKTK